MSIADDQITTTDTSGRALPIFLAIVLGFLYIMGVFWLAGRSNRFHALGAFAAFPLAQFLYIGPLAFFTYKTGRKRALQGWLIGAAVATFLYSPCWALALVYHA